MATRRERNLNSELGELARRGAGVSYPYPTVYEYELKPYDRDKHETNKEHLESSRFMFIQD